MQMTTQDTILPPQLRASLSFENKNSSESNFLYYISLSATPCQARRVANRRDSMNAVVPVFRRNHFVAMDGNTTVDQKLLRRRLLLKKGCTGMFLGLILGLVIPFILTSILHLLGFGTKGIVPGSIAAEWEASLHNITKGTFFACKFSKTFPTLSKG